LGGPSGQLQIHYVPLEIVHDGSCRPVAACFRDFVILLGCPKASRILPICGKKYEAKTPEGSTLRLWSSQFKPSNHKVALEAETIPHLPILFRKRRSGMSKARRPAAPLFSADGGGHFFGAPDVLHHPSPGGKLWQGAGLPRTRKTPSCSWYGSTAVKHTGDHGDLGICEIN